MLDRRELYRIWAPEGATYSPWVKPVLFAHMDPKGVARALPPDDLPDATWAPRPSDKVAIVLDLPGVPAVAHGLALARRGFQPVLLHNTSPGPLAVLDVAPIQEAVVGGTKVLERHPIAPGSPPAFILDSRRLAPRPKPGAYDNRWVVFPQDFPSAHVLRAGGIEHVMVVSEAPREPAHDLRSVLVGWRRGGLGLHLVSTQENAPPRTYTPRTHWTWRPLVLAALVRLGLRANSAGGFGAIIPVPAEGGYS